MRQLVFSEGFSATTEDHLLRKIKDLAVTGLHSSVHTVTLHNMTLQDSETVEAFAARVKGTAGNCNLMKVRSKEGCTENVSFMEETVYNVVMVGICDKDLGGKVLTRQCSPL